jgi:WD repeat/SOCS box-containing protein 1
MLELLDHRELIRDLKFAPDGSLRLVSASRDGRLKVWDMDDDGNMMKTLISGMKWVYACAWSPDAKMLCSVGDGRSVVLWDMESYDKKARLDGHNHEVCSCDFSPDGALLATASYDTQVILWDPHTLQKLTMLMHMHPPPSPIFAGGANGAYVRGVSFSHDGHHIATVADDSYIRFWNLFNGECPEQVAAMQNALCCSFSPDGAALAVGSRNGTVSMYLSPMQVSSLQHLCRMAIRRLLPSTKVDELLLPTRMKKFLNYISPQCP